MNTYLDFNYILSVEFELKARNNAKGIVDIVISSCIHQSIMIIDIFKVLPIGEKVFSYLEKGNLLKCRQVCKNWKLILNEPIFWLDKLKSIGHPETAQKQWLDLIQKTILLKKPKQMLSLSLMLKYCTYPRLLEDKGNEAYRKMCLNFPPIWTATKHGQLEVVKIIHQFDKYCNGPFSKLPSNYTPLNLAIRYQQTEVVKYLVENIEVKIMN